MVTAADQFIALTDEAGGRAEVTSSQGSLIAAFDLQQGWIYPLPLSPERKGMVQLCLAYLATRPAFADQAVRQRLYDDLVAIVGPLSTATLNGYPGFNARKLNDPAVAAALGDFLRRLRSEAEGGQ